MPRLFVDDVEIERWHPAGQAAGVDGVGPDLAPQLDHVARDRRKLLPFFQRRHFAEQRERQVAVQAQLLASIDAGGGRWGAAHDAGSSSNDSGNAATRAAAVRSANAQSGP